MPEHPQNDNGSTGTPPNGDCSSPIPSHRLGIGIWFPLAMAALPGVVAAFVVWHNGKSAMAPAFVALCAAVGLIIGGAFWAVDRFAPAPDHAASLFALGPAGFSYCWPQ